MPRRIRQRPRYERAMVTLAGVTRLADDLRFLLYFMKIMADESRGEPETWGRWASLDHALF